MQFDAESFPGPISFLERKRRYKEQMPGSGPYAPHSADPGELVQRIALRDHEAFSTLFLIVGPKVKGYLMSQGASAAGAEEIAQEVMITIWRKAALFDPRKAAAMTWIFVIARNLRIDSLRRERSTTTYGAQPPERADESSPSAADAADWRERESRVRAAMAGLSEDQREVIRRSFFEDEPHARIADALGLPLGTVKSRLRLAMSKLRARLEDLQ